VKTTPRKKTGLQGVPRHQLTTRGDGASSSRNPNLDSQAEVARLTSEIERLKRNMHFLEAVPERVFGKGDRSQGLCLRVGALCDTPGVVQHNSA
jgi:hypothetical protein